MSMFTAFNVSASGMTAQQLRTVRNREWSHNWKSQFHGDEGRGNGFKYIYE